jgi:site-specific DNA-methyltransferase (adenine-specific)
MVLATANAQGELSPLEIGMHALHYVAKDKRGKGAAGGGLKGYAEALGKDASHISKYRNAAEVSELINGNVAINDLLTRAAHLSAIHKLPEEAWGIAAEAMLRGDKSARDTAAMVDGWKACLDAVAGTGWLADVAELTRLLASDGITMATIRKCLGTLDDIRATVAKNNLDPQRVDDFLSKCPKTHREFVEFQQELLATMFESRSQWNLGPWQDHLGQLDDESVALMLTDPPYGMEYRSNYRKEKHDAIQGDESTDAFRLSLEAIMPKLKADAHVLAFVNWRNEAAFIAACEAFGLTVKSRIVWVKNNTGMGDLDGAFAPKHEMIIHAVKGNPKLYTRTADVLECARVATDKHPTEKPVALLQTLIETCTVKGQLVADPFGGVASVAVAAKRTGREFWSCEIEEKYFRHGKERLENE